MRTIYDLYLNSTAKLNIGVMKSVTSKDSIDIEDAEYYIKLGIQGRMIYAEQSSDPNDWNHVAWALVTLGEFFTNSNRFEEGDSCFRKANTIYQKISSTYFRGNEYKYARLYEKWGWLYMHCGKLSMADSCYIKAWMLYSVDVGNPNPQKDGLCALGYILRWGFSKLYKTLHREDEIDRLYCELRKLYLKHLHVNRAKLEPEYASLLINHVYFYMSTSRFTESEAMLKESLDIYHRLAQSNPQAYEPYVAHALNGLGTLYSNTQRLTEAVAMFKESLEILRRLAQANPQALRGDYAATIGNQSWCAIFMKQYAESEQLAREGLAIDSTQHFIYSSLAAALLFQGKYSEAEKIYLQYKTEQKESFLDDFSLFADAGVIPKECEADVEKIKKLLNEE